jgi:hypothetical protein
MTGKVAAEVCLELCQTVIMRDIRFLVIMLISNDLPGVPARSAGDVESLRPFSISPKRPPIGDRGLWGVGRGAGRGAAEEA